MRKFNLEITVRSESKEKFDIVVGRIANCCPYDGAKFVAESWDSQKEGDEYVGRGTFEALDRTMYESLLMAANSIHGVKAKWSCTAE